MSNSKPSRDIGEQRIIMPRSELEKAPAEEEEKRGFWSKVGETLRGFVPFGRRKKEAVESLSESLGIKGGETRELTLNIEPTVEQLGEQHAEEQDRLATETESEVESILYQEKKLEKLDREIKELEEERGDLLRDLDSVKVDFNSQHSEDLIEAAEYPFVRLNDEAQAEKDEMINQYMKEKVDYRGKNVPREQVLKLLDTRIELKKAVKDDLEQTIEIARAEQAAKMVQEEKAQQERIDKLVKYWREKMTPEDKLQDEITTLKEDLAPLQKKVRGFALHGEGRAESSYRKSLPEYGRLKNKIEDKQSQLRIIQKGPERERMLEERGLSASEKAAYIMIDNLIESMSLRDLENYESFIDDPEREKAKMDQKKLEELNIKYFNKINWARDYFFRAKFAGGGEVKLREDIADELEERFNARVLELLDEFGREEDKKDDLYMIK